MTAEISAAVICGWFVLDHSFDHLRIWTTWKQCLQENPKASFSDTKAPKSLVNQAKNRWRFLWDVDAAGSNPATPTKNQPKTSLFRLVFGYFLYIFHKIRYFQLTTCLPDFWAFYWIFHGFFLIILKIPFLCLLRRKFWGLTIDFRQPSLYVTFLFCFYT